MMRTGRDKGFTLVEIIIAIVITASLGLAVYTTLTQGLRLWARAAKDRGEWKVDLWTEKTIGNLRNTFQDPLWPLKGTRTELFFPTLLHEGGEKFSGGIPVYFRFTFDSKAQTVAAQRYPFEDVLMSRSESKTAVSVLEKILDFQLEYYTYDPKAKAYRWESQWNKDCFPETVKITIEPEQMNHRKWVRMINIPTEYACPK